jgi:hypothetical protein
LDCSVNFANFGILRTPQRHFALLRLRVQCAESDFAVRRAFECQMRRLDEIKEVFVPGSAPEGSLIADAHGDLFGTTGIGGANGNGTQFGEGTVFEITGSGFRGPPDVKGVHGSFSA